MSRIIALKGCEAYISPRVRSPMRALPRSRRMRQWPEFRSQAGALAREGKQGMKAAQTKVAVISNSLLAAVGRVLGGVNVDDQPPPVFFPQ